MLFQTRFGELTPTTEGAWRALAVSALSSGLAYGGENSPFVTGFVSDLFDTLRDPEFLSNHEGNAWTPVTSHTFDACLVACDAAQLIVIFVVDED